MMIPENVNKYIKKYSLPGWEIEHAGLDNINNVVVIPAICEFENIKTLLASLAENEGKYFPYTLYLFVINNSAEPEENIRLDNANTLAYLRTIIKNDISTCDELQRKINSTGLRIALVDASSAGKELPIKDAGVGLARKIGLDLVLGTFNYNSSDKKILICLDADCTVEKNYLTEIIENFNNKNLTAAIINFSHQINGGTELDPAIICYEIFLRYYVLGLRYAGSPYAFHTVGSTIACDYESYVKAEGMNKRKAAEDFYFMEKLAKIVSIDKITGTTVHPSGRSSWRVPFGTGQRVNRFLAHTHNDFLLYNPKTFSILKEWINEFNSPAVNDADFYLAKAAEIDFYLHRFLIEQNFSDSWSKILKSSASCEQANRQKIKWFDGFKTLKLIHYLRDSAYPLINMFEAADELFGLCGINFYPGRKGKDIPSIEIQKEYLNILRKNA